MGPPRRQAAAFTLLDYVLLRPLPFPDAERLVMVYQTQLVNGYSIRDE